MSEIQEVREFLMSEGERVQREIANYAQLNQSVTLAATKIKAETVGTWKNTAITGEAHSVARSNFPTGARGLNRSCRGLRSVGT
jgi:hypothetical protein